MKPRYETVVSLFIALACALTGVADANGLDYPKARRDARVDVYHGVEVADPYRWLEDLGAAETRAFMVSQENLLASYLDRERVRALERRIEILGETGASVSVPIFAGGRYFYTVREPEQRLAVILARRRGRESDGVPILDPNVRPALTSRILRSPHRVPFSTTR